MVSGCQFVGSESFLIGLPGSTRNFGHRHMCLEKRIFSLRCFGSYNDSYPPTRYRGLFVWSRAEFGSRCSQNPFSPGIFFGKFCGETLQPNSDSAAPSACSEPPIRSRLPVSVQVRGGARGLRVTRHGLRVRVVHWTEPAWATVRLHLGSPLAGQGPCLGIDSATPRPWPAVRLHSTPSSPGRGPTRSQPEAEALLEFRVRTIRNHRAT